MMCRTRTIWLLLLAATCGCRDGGKKMTYITHYPDWQYTSYERIAVVPVKYPAPGHVVVAFHPVPEK